MQMPAARRLSFPLDEAVAATLRRLPYFLAVAEELHFGRAARRLALAQPPLSQQIRALEREIGFLLFDRGRARQRNVRLTPAGTTLLAAMRRATAIAADGVHAASRVAQGYSGTLTVGISASVMLTPVARLIRAYQEQYPNVCVRLREMVATAQLAALDTREIDVGFVREPPPAAGLSIAPVWRERFAVALPSRHPCAVEKRISLDAIAGEPFVLFPRTASPAFYDKIVEMCRAAGFAPRVVQESTDWQSVVGFVASGVGIAIVPDSVRVMRAPGVIYRRLHQSAPMTTIFLAWREDDQSAQVLGLRSLSLGFERRTAHATGNLLR
jgi:DNA-binding transcriptional LysR family regulator